jgi:hypothetical protein
MPSYLAPDFHQIAKEAAKPLAVTAYIKLVLICGSITLPGANTLAPNASKKVAVSVFVVSIIQDLSTKRDYHP